MRPQLGVVAGEDGAGEDGAGRAGEGAVAGEATPAFARAKRGTIR
jgi:hypothetical protein